MRLLHEVSKDKLMILVTHNYEQVQPYATRKITMHDGKLIEDKKIKPVEKQQNTNISNPKQIRLISKFFLGIRNAFNILPKFLLILSVYIFLCLAMLGGYSSLKKQQYENSKLGYNFYFSDTNDKRIIIKKQDKSMITKEDYNRIKTLSNIDSIVENDLTLDKYFSANGQRYGFPAKLATIQQSPPNVDMGRMPENENEVIMEMTKNYIPVAQIQDNILEKEFELRETTNWMEVFENKLKIVGIVFHAGQSSFTNQPTIYIDNAKMNQVRKIMNTTYSALEVEFNGHILEIGEQYRIIPNKKVPNGKAYADSLTLTIDKIYNKRNIKQLLGIEEYNPYQYIFYVNDEDYYQLFDKGNYQSSVFIKNEKEAPQTIQTLKDMGYQTLYVKDTLVNYNQEVQVINNAITIVIIVMVMVALFFLSYFIIKIILKSRNVYYSTIRMLGATRKNAKQLLKMELITVLNIAYILVILSGILIQNEVISQELVSELLSYIQMKDYILLYVVLMFLSLQIANRYARQLFKKSVMNTYREEV